MATLSVSYEAELYYGNPGEDIDTHQSDHPDQIIDSLVDDLFPEPERLGSGMGFGRRDVQYKFRNKTDAERVWKHIKEFCPFPIQLNNIYETS